MVFRMESAPSLDNVRFFERAGLDQGSFLGSESFNLRF